MMQTTPPSFQGLLDSLEGIAYITSPEGLILEYGAPHWDDFALNNAAPHLTRPAEVCGRPLSDFIAGVAVRAAHEVAAEVVKSLRMPSVTYTYRCDAPDLRRDMRMTIIPLLKEGALQGLLYHSICLRETSRPKLKFLSPLPDVSLNTTKLISVCSYCRSVRHPTDSGVWITPERYYELGEDDYADVSHGICPECWATIVQPMMEEIQAIRCG